MQENKMNRKNTLLIFAIILAIFLLITGLLLIFKFSKLNKNNPQTDNVNQINNEKILNQLKIDKYLGIVLNVSPPLNENLLDSKYAFFNYYLYNDENLYKIKIQFGEDSNNSYLYCKYSDYLSSYQKLLGTIPDETGLKSVYLPNLIELNANSFKTNLMDIKKSTNKHDPNCYTPLVLDWNEPKDVEFSSLVKQNNTISGNVRIITLIDNSQYYLDGTFEFNYLEENNIYYASSLRIKSLGDAYRQIINKN